MKVRELHAAHSCQPLIQGKVQHVRSQNPAVGTCPDSSRCLSTARGLQPCSGSCMGTLGQRVLPSAAARCWPRLGAGGRHRLEAGLQSRSPRLTGCVGNASPSVPWFVWVHSTVTEPELGELGNSSPGSSSQPREACSLCARR